jgi:hypothetical protein
MTKYEIAKSIYDLEKECKSHRIGYCNVNCSECPLHGDCEGLFTYKGEPIKINEIMLITNEFTVTEDLLERLKNEESSE